jgi:hypothetical protein
MNGQKGKGENHASRITFHVSDRLPHLFAKDLDSSIIYMYLKMLNCDIEGEKIFQEVTKSVDINENTLYYNSNSIGNQ